MITQTNDLTSFLEERYLRSEDDYRVYYLPLFNFGDPVWSPLRVEMFKRLRHASGINKTPSVVERVFTNDCNPEGDKEAVSFIHLNMPTCHLMLCGCYQYVYHRSLYSETLESNFEHQTLHKDLAQCYLPVSI